MRKKRTKLTLLRETLQGLQASALATIAGASLGIAACGGTGIHNGGGTHTDCFYSCLRH
jgi:hypothetical protein